MLLQTPASLHSLARSSCICISISHCLACIYIYHLRISQRPCILLARSRLIAVWLIYNRVRFAFVCGGGSQRSQNKKKGLITKSKAFFRKSNKKENSTYHAFFGRQFILPLFLSFDKKSNYKKLHVHLVFRVFITFTHQTSIRLSIIVVSPHVYMHALSRHAATITDRRRLC